MKGSVFLRELYRSSDLGFIEPGANMMDAYLRKSDSFFTSGVLLVENERLEEAVSLLYYSMFYCAQALLFRAGIRYENHAGTIRLLEAVFGMDCTDIDHAKKERIDKQYNVDSEAVEEDVEELVGIAEHFNAELLHFMGRLTNERVEGYRTGLKDLMNIS